LNWWLIIFQTPHRERSEPAVPPQCNIGLRDPPHKVD
jgi:hypothetical protein